MNLHIGETFGRIKVLEFSHFHYFASGRRKPIVKGICSCGKEWKGFLSALTKTTEPTTSCGCYAIKSRTIHGMTNSEEYTSYHAAKARCNNTNSEHYYRYGFLGIKFLYKSFDEFYKELGKRPDEYELDRIDNNGNYEPGNCRWVSPKTNMLNRGNTRFIEFFGEKFPAFIISKILKRNLTYATTLSKQSKSYQEFMLDKEFKRVGIKTLEELKEQINILNYGNTD